jgi:SAM-dependent methyltransferase
MKSLSATGPNAEQITYWNEESGAKWVAHEAHVDAQIAPLGLAAMERAEVAEGESVLDVGCGCGESSLQLANRVGPAGSVTGLDVSAVMLERARERARAAGLTNLRFENADAQTFGFDAAHFDLLFSRFGVMFFDDPTAAFANLRSALGPGGRLAFVCWQEIRRNPWMLVPVLAAAPHVELPPPPAEGAPGPFAFAQVDRVRGILEAAGFEAIAIDPLESELTLAGGGDLERAVEFALQMGPAGRILRGVDDTTRGRVRESVREALAPHATSEGVRLGCSAFIVSAASGT